MARPKKNGRNVNFVLSQDLYNRLTTYIEKEKRTKTSVFELALSEFLDKEESKKEKND